MSEVELFCASHPELGDSFQRFAIQYSTLAEVWENCSRSDWMLSILSKRKYRNAEKLEKYIDWLFEQVKTINDEEAWDLRRSYFNKYEGYVEELKGKLAEGKISESEFKYHRFFVMWHTSADATVYVLKDRITDLEIDNIFARALNKQENEEVLPIVNINESEQTFEGLLAQAQKLREILGNPFTHSSHQDFYYGKDNYSRNY